MKVEPTAQASPCFSGPEPYQEMRSAWPGRVNTSPELFTAEEPKAESLTF